MSGCLAGEMQDGLGDPATLPKSKQNGGWKALREGLTSVYKENGWTAQPVQWDTLRSAARRPTTFSTPMRIADAGAGM